MALRALLVLVQDAAEAPIEGRLAPMRMCLCIHSHGVAHDVVPQVRDSNARPDQRDRLLLTACDYLEAWDSRGKAPMGARSSSSLRTPVKAF